jgi:hypothetical protein
MRGRGLVRLAVFSDALLTVTKSEYIMAALLAATLIMGLYVSIFM